MNEDWAAAMDSDVFKEYLKNELRREATASKNDPKLDTVLDSFTEFEKKVNENPKLKKVFAKWQEVFSKDMSYREGVDQGFVDAVMMLNIQNESQE